MLIERVNSNNSKNYTQNLTSKFWELVYLKKMSALHSPPAEIPCVCLYFFSFVVVTSFGYHLYTMKA